MIKELNKKMNMNMNMNMNTSTNMNMNMNEDMIVNPFQQQYMNLSSAKPSDVADVKTELAQSSTMGELIFDKFINHVVDHPDHQAESPVAPASASDRNATVQSHDDVPPTLFHMNSSDPTIGSTEISATELSASIVDNFFDPSSSADSTPMFELDNQDLGGVETWTSLFDNDIPVTLDDVSASANAATLELELESNAKQQQQQHTSESQVQLESVASESNVSIVNDLVAPSTTSMASLKQNQFLPTPMLEDDLQLPKPRKASASASVSTSTSASGKVTKSSVRSSSSSTKLDDLGVIAYSRKQRSAPLTPVIPESDDPLAVKRAKNTEAARRSRARKLQRMNQLEEKVKELLERNSDLENEVIRLRSMLGSQ